MMFIVSVISRNCCTLDVVPSWPRGTLGKCSRVRPSNRCCCSFCWAFDGLFFVILGEVTGEKLSSTFLISVLGIISSSPVCWISRHSMTSDEGANMALREPAISSRAPLEKYMVIIAFRHLTCIRPAMGISAAFSVCNRNDCAPDSK